MLDVTEYYLPLDLSQVFGNNNDSALEIGFGDGSFLVEIAKAKTDWNYIGIEIKVKRFRKAVKRAKLENLTNLKFLLMDVRIAIEELFFPKTFNTVYINFPDPWPKERHKKHRIINTQLLKKLSTIMKPKGILEIASDQEEYISYILQALKNTDIFKSIFPPPGYVNIIPNRPKTRFEMDYMKKKKEIYYLRFIKTK
jgi:tRNA (guanine-N7-)-methyltransferase